MRRGFTLIELLIVVLVVGILTSLALPQYQKAVKKAELSRYMTAVKALAQAEKVYFLARGEYTQELDQLTIGVSFTHCPKKKESFGQYYECSGNVRYGIFNDASNVQAGDANIRYAHVLKDSNNNGVSFKAGDVACYSKGDFARKVCKSLGKGVEKKATGWNYIYIM